MSADIYVARTNGLIVHNGRRYFLQAGRTTVRAGHPILSGHEHQFEPLRVDIDTTVEEATAEPGKKRRVARAKTAADDGDR